MIFSSLASAALLLLGADTAWQPVSHRDGVLLEQRPVSGNPYYEYRATLDTDVTVGALCDVVFDWGSRSGDHDELRSRRVLEDHGDVRVTYDQIATPPLVPPRDFAFTVKRERKGEDCKLTFTTTNEKAPPLERGWVRMPAVRGYWLFEARAAGTRVTYVLFSDPGAGLPTQLVHGPQREAVVKNAQKGVQLSRQAVTGARRP